MKSRCGFRTNILASAQRSAWGGFTLTELMITLAIVAIISAFAVPSFNSSINDNRNQTASSDLLTSINVARSEAIRRARSVTVCPSSNGTTCSTDWAQGWIVFVDGVSTGTPSVGTILLNGDALSETTVTLTLGSNNWIRFTSRGGTSSATTLSVSPTDCSAGGRYRDIKILASGRTNISTYTCTQ